MYHISLPPQQNKKIDYNNLPNPSQQDQIHINEIKSDDVPQAPDGFCFYRVHSGDTLITLSVKFGINENRIKRYNRAICFGHRLTHLNGKLLLIPLKNDAKLTPELQEQIETLYLNDEETHPQEDKKYEEPNENGKYNLRKALMYHIDVEESRANYYLGEANWNVRKAIQLYHEDTKWEKQQKIEKSCIGITKEEVEVLLKKYDNNVESAIKDWRQQQLKNNKNQNNIKQHIDNNNINNNNNNNNNINYNTTTTTTTSNETEGVKDVAISSSQSNTNTNTNINNNTATTLPYTYFSSVNSTSNALNKETYM